MTSFFDVLLCFVLKFICPCSLSLFKWKNWMQKFSHFIWIAYFCCCRCVCVCAYTHSVYIKSNEFDFYSQTNLFPLHLILWIALSANNRAAKCLRIGAYSFCVIFTNWSRSHHIIRKCESQKSCEKFATIGNTAIKHIALGNVTIPDHQFVSLFTRCFIKIHLRLAKH